MKYVIGILAIVVGCVLVVFSEWFLNNFGRIEWAEEHLGGEGGTRLMYKLIGIIMIILALLGMTGALGEIILSIFGRLFGL